MKFVHIWRTSCDNFEVEAAAAPNSSSSSSSSTWWVQRWKSKKKKTKIVMMKEKLALLLLALVHFCAAQDLTLPYFNIAEKKKVTVNATCGEDPTRKDVYCKLVGYDSIMTQSANEILDGQVNLNFTKLVKKSYSTIFLVKSKLSKAKKCRTSTISRLFLSIFFQILLV